MNLDIPNFPEIRKEIYGKLIKELQASAYEFQEDAETWKARINGPRLRSVYDPGEQAAKSAFAALVYADVAAMLKRDLEA
ncbi:MAG: hypothetical protein ABIO72_05830 [Patescibacteria group bacterium]